jgi:hypothetical protein
LAGGLDTFTTSDYNYAKHLKDLSLDTLSAGVKGEVSYQSYLYSASCGKFLNTLLCLTLKKAKSLETFRWNIRVELSRPVYQTLHRIASLKKLHVRMQAGESYYRPPPPLPASSEPSVGGPPAHWTEIPPLPPTPVPAVMPLHIFGTSPPNPTSVLPALASPAKSLPRSKTSRKTPLTREPPTLSGFKNLKSLCILDIDDLDIVTELKACVENSSSTLTELQLSFSDTLASQARKPPPDSDPDDSDLDDEFHIAPSSHTPPNDGSGPIKAFRAQEERQVQEAVLGKILGVNDLSRRISHQGPEAKIKDLPEDKKEADDSVDRDPREDFISSIRSVSAQLLDKLNGSSDLNASQQEILDIIEQAARKYVNSGDSPAQQSNDVDAFGEAANTQGTGGATLTFRPSITSHDAPSGDRGAESSSPQIIKTQDNTDSAKDTVTHAECSSASNTLKGKGIARDTMSPDDIDMEHIDTVDGAFEDSEDQKPENSYPAGRPAGRTALDSAETSLFGNSARSAVRELSDEKTVLDLARRKMRYEGLSADYNKLQNRIDQLRASVDELKLDGASADKGPITHVQKELLKVIDVFGDVEKKLSVLRVEIEAMEQQVTPQSKEASAVLVRRCMNDYVRHTRGFSLESLSIHLIPVKASVLSRAVNLRSLRSLTLLNVGNQTPIWTLLSRENKTFPLPLRNVFTDNASPAFLTCMSQLEELHELFMLERSPKHTPESFAQPAKTTIEQIRRQVLSKHMPTLKRLMIKDDSPNSSWDANMKTVAHICKRGSQLEELGLSMDIHGVHAFMQFLPGLVNLRAIHIIHFRNNDTCIWVMREILRFMVDNLSHLPQLKVEWIAMAEDRVDRVVWNADDSQKKSRDQGRKSVTKTKVTTASTASAAYPLLPSLPAESESDSEEDGFDSGSRLRVRTFGPVQFHDVWGVKIFEKEIRSGRL